MERKFKMLSPTQLWADVQSMERNLSNLYEQAATALLAFPTAYLYEAGFFTLTMVKTMYRKQLQPEDNIRCALATMFLDFDKLAKQVQRLGSHLSLQCLCAQ